MDYGELRYGKLNKEFHEHAHTDLEDRDDRAPKFSIPPEKVDSIISEIEVQFNDFVHIHDAVRHMLIMSKELREDEEDNGMVVKTIWNGYELEVQWSWNREINWDYVNEVVRKGGSGDDDPSGMWVYPQEEWSEMNEEVRADG